MRYFTVFFCKSLKTWCTFYIHSTSGFRVISSYVWLLVATFDHGILGLSFPKLMHQKNAGTNI